MNVKNHECNVLNDSRILSAKESKILANILNLFERRTEQETGVCLSNGGFAEADMYRYDDDYFDIELKWGVDWNGDSEIHTEQYKLPRDAVKPNTKIEEAIEQIQEA